MGCGREVRPGRKLAEVDRLHKQTLLIFERGAMPRVSQRGASVKASGRDDLNGPSRNFGGEIANVSPGLSAEFSVLSVFCLSFTF